MSLVGMIDEYVRLQTGDRPRHPRRRRSGDGTPDDEHLLQEGGLPADQAVDIGGYFRKLVEYIPAESIAIYTVGLPWATPAQPDTSYTGRWILAAVVLVLTPVFTASYYAFSARKRNIAFKWPAARMGAASLAFTAWIYALPSSPFADFGFYDPKQGVLVVVVVSALIATAARFTACLDPEPQ